ncbi:MAG: phospholipase [Pseudomonadota bacterium]
MLGPPLRHSHSALTVIRSRSNLRGQTMTGSNEILVEALQAALPPLLRSLDVLSYIVRHMHPPRIPALIEKFGDEDGAVLRGVQALQGPVWPPHLQPVIKQIEAVAGEVCKAFTGLRSVGQTPNGMMEVYYALRHATLAQELLYPLASRIPMVSRFFLDEAQREDEALLAKLETGATRDNTGVMHSTNTTGDTRGGFSLFVPENYDETVNHPLIFALHGGSGHGRSFLWSWLRAARSRGAILISPSSRGQTWALQGPDTDTPNLLSMLAYVRERWNVDERRILLTGMSDGGTFTYISGLQGEQPYTHLAPVAASFHPLLLEFFPAERMKGLPIHITHGALDWMFPAANAQAMAAALQEFGAQVVYRQIANLSHTYPSNEENTEVMNWFLTP